MYQGKIAFRHDKLMYLDLYTLQAEFAGGGALRCGEYVTLRKVGDASHKVSYRAFTLLFC